MNAPGENPSSIGARPNRVPWPPLLYGAALIGGLTLARLLPLPWPGLLGAGAVAIAGATCAVLGLGLDGWALITLHRARTNILPHRAADHLVTHGPFALTRNPIYLGNTLLVVGLGIALSNAWLVAAGLAAAIATDRLAARREEAHLAARFGAPFEAYRAKVPRWIIR